MVKLERRLALRRPHFHLLSAAILLVAACGDSDSKPKTDVQPEASLVAVEVTEDHETEHYDLNGDGKPDVSKVYSKVAGAPGAPKKRVLARTDLDVNFDAKVDMRQFFNNDGVMLREEMDLDFDGKTDAVDHYLEGAIIRREIFLNFNEKPSIWKFYEEGRLVRKERDESGDGKPDTFEYYEGDQIVRVGFDRNGDGKPDYYEEANTGK